MKVQTEREACAQVIEEAGYSVVTEDPEEDSIYKSMADIRMRLEGKNSLQ